MVGGVLRVPNMFCKRALYFLLDSPIYFGKSPIYSSKEPYISTAKKTYI